MGMINAVELADWIDEQFCRDMPKHWDRTAEAIIKKIYEMSPEEEEDK